MNVVTESIKVTVDFEKEIHKKISNMRYGETFTIETVSKTNECKKAIQKSIQKSAKYNCMTLNLRWSPIKNEVKVTHVV